MSAADAAWLVEESGFDRSRANYQETLFTVGNGRLGTRGSLEEAGCSWFPSPDALAHHDAGNPIPEEQLPDFAEHCLRHGVRAVCVTLDQRGCVAYQLDESGALVEQEVPRIVVDNVVDATGAGDSFAAGMAFGFMQSHDIVAAARYGNAMGAQRVSGSGLDVYRSLAETDKQIADAYGEAAS